MNPISLLCVISGMVVVVATLFFAWVLAAMAARMDDQEGVR